MSEIRRAAERLVGFDDPYDNTYWDGNKSPFNPDRDGVTVAKAWLAANPVDDELAVDEDWLRSVGFYDGIIRGLERLMVKMPSLIDSQWLEVGPASFSHGIFHVCRISDEMIEDEEILEDHVDVNCKTRGQLRTLAKALGVELREVQP
jgi:hypothetical protein